MDNGKNLRNAENWTLETRWENTKINPLGHVNSNTKVLEHWLIFENFKFFTEISNFIEIWIMSKHKKTQKRLALEEGREAAEIIISDSYFYLPLLNFQWKFSSFG